ncbi:putative F-box/LRR-repeat protein [Cardamine amara subsp. amara]|uniref:F-box/LRR-repeat protein n=1 Tax=Cardamine amara subsp. amara TaxID=228776 RepID=A0ABD0ZU84_CARAN
MADDGGNRDGATAAVRDPSLCCAHLHGEIKGAGDSREDLDSISSLPDVILQQILSCIETEEAIRTSVLSRRWRHVWPGTPSISFVWPTNRILDADSIDKTLARYTSRKMMSFHIDVDMMSNLTHVSRWIELAMSRKAENLTLELGCHPCEANYIIPDFFYTNSYVKQLSLHLYFTDLIPRCSVSWSSLKQLFLSACNLSDESIANILSGCPILESLTLEVCKELMVLDLSKSPRLTVLEVNCYTLLTDSMQIVGPHIHNLRLENSQSGCTLLDVSSLTEASLDIRFDSYNELFKADFLQAFALEQLDKLQNVEKLTLGENFLKVLSLTHYRLEHLSPLPMFKAKVLTLETTISPYVIPGIIVVLENSPELKKLTLIHKRLDGFIPEEVLDNYLGLRALNLFQGMTVGNYSENRVLKSKEVALFIEFMLNHTQTLGKLVLRLEGCLQGRGFDELVQIVPTLSRANNVSIVIS